MKKILAILLCAAMVLSLIACGAEKEETSNDVNVESGSDIVTQDIGNEDTITENVISESDEESEFPLQVIVYDDNKADILYSFDGDSAPVSCEINMGKYGVALVDFGNGYQCNICLIDGAGSTMVADCLYSIDGNTIVFNVDMTAFEDFAFTNVTDYETFADFGAGGGKIIYTAKDVTKQGEQVATEDNSPEIQESLENSETAEDENKNDTATSLYLGIKYSDGANTIVFHGTDPIHPTAMTINGNKITFDSVVVAQNDEYYIHLGFSWTYDNMLNQGDMHYDRDNRHIVLKGFAIANEYVPVE